ncbi:hypothetical protein RhiirA5_420578 [Rhizophagus irregularis]|uniref:Uncharacterized protein n=1 Tax=Rhizophagus irregularis TaxID=588596 RepID=A0A2N0PFW6_9GLOM|nr:hypothetical protein RhiirA5_420578 [Rhizophagus irregularis]
MIEKKYNLPRRYEVEWFVSVLQKQGSILKELLTKLREYSDMVEHTGIKVLGDEWMWAREGKKEIEQKLHTAMHTLPSPVNENVSSRDDTTKIEKIATASDLLEEGITLLKRVCEITFSPVIVKTISTTMSASFLDDLNAFQRKIKKKLQNWTVTKMNSLPWPVSLHDTLSLELLKGEILGGTLTRSSSLTSSCTKKYHPLQLMNYSVLPFTREKTGNGDFLLEPTILDLSLAPGHLKVGYDLSLLTDRKQALRFGQLASTVTGLNYKLVQRLRSIYSYTLVPPPSTRYEGGSGHDIADLAFDSTGRLRVTFDRETVYSTTGPPFVSNNAGADMKQSSFSNKWAPFNGVNARIASYTEIVTSIAINTIYTQKVTGSDPSISTVLEEISSAGKHVQRTYENAANSCQLPEGFLSSDQVVKLIVQKFETLGEKETKIDSVSDFLDIVCSLIISLFDEKGMEFWKKNVLQAFSTKPNYSYYEHEVFLSHAVQVRETAQLLKKIIQHSVTSLPMDSEIFITHQPDKMKVIVVEIGNSDNAWDCVRIPESSNFFRDCRIKSPPIINKFPLKNLHSGFKVANITPVRTWIKDGVRDNLFLKFIQELAEH